MYECNHDEADTRIVLNASKSPNSVVVIANDTNILVFL